MEKLKFTQVVNGNKEQYDLLLPLWRDFIHELDANRNEHTTDAELERNLLRRISIQGTRSDMHFEIAYLDNIAIGFSNYAIDLGTIYGLFEKGGGAFLGYYIAPSHRRKGYARQMFEHCENVLFSDGAKFLYTCPEPNIGVPFWNSVGFNDSGKVDPDDKLPIYIKNISRIEELEITDVDEKSRVCRIILEALPDWFGIPEAIDNYEKNVRGLLFWTAYDGERPVGFIALSEHNPYTAELDVMGILSEYQRKGIGKRLLEAAEQCCMKRGKSMLLVKTIDFSHPDVYYARTRAFYMAMGFVPLQVLAGYWDGNNPCLLFGKYLGHEIKIRTVPVGSKTVDCSGIIQWAETWDWGVGQVVSKRLRNNGFNDWETIFIATLDGQNAGFFILEKRDSYGTDLDLALTPFITAVYVDPKFRGFRISEKLLGTVCNFARSLEFDAVYLISNEQGFYEKFGFDKFTQTVTITGKTEPVYRKIL